MFKYNSQPHYEFTRKMERQIVWAHRDLVPFWTYIIKLIFTSIFTLYTDAFEKLYKEIEIFLYYDLKTPGSTSLLHVKHSAIAASFFNTLLGVLISRSKERFLVLKTSILTIDT